MDPWVLILLCSVGWLAYSNGANDNFKGVATLFGSGTVGYRRAIWLATVTTFLGSMTTLILGQALIKAFSGKGLVTAAVLAEPSFLVAVSAGAAGTVLLATLFGFPISTTHAIIGSLTGAGLLADGGVAMGRLIGKFLMPLLLVPIITIGITAVLYLLFRKVRRSAGIVRQTCICLGQECQVVGLETPALTVEATEDGQVLLTGFTSPPTEPKAITFSIGSELQCIYRYQGRFLGISAQGVLDIMHYISAGAVGFARGLQDTAKIVGLLAGAGLVGAVAPGNLRWAVLLVGVLMALGGLFNARKVAETMSRKITEMNPGQGFTGNLVTSAMVIISGIAGWGVSTTHCAVGALFGISAVNRRANWQTISGILIAWIATLPVAAMLAAAIYWTIR